MKKFLCLILAVSFLICTACSNEAKPSDAVNEGKDSPPKTQITIYYPDRQGISLVGETLEVEADGNNLAQTVVQKLIEGPKSDGLLTLIPKGTRLNKADVNNGICTVDLSSEFVTKRGGSVSDTLLVYSVVNSLTSLEGINEVMFLIDGKKLEIFGNFIFDEPFKANAELNK